MFRALLLLLLPIFLLSGCSTSEKKLDKPFYWEAKKGSHRIYFLGTIHEPVSLSKLPSRVLSQIEGAGVVYVETDLDKARKDVGPAYDKYFTEFYSGISEPYPHLMDKLSSTAQTNVRHMLNHPSTKKYLKSLGIKFPVEHASPALVDMVFSEFATNQKKFEVFHPDMVSNFLKIGQNNAKRASVHGSASFLDQQILDFAKKSSVSVKGLDSEGFTAGIMGNILKMSHEEYGLEKIESLFGDRLILTAEYIDVTSKLLDSYSRGDLTGIAAVISSTPSEFKEKFLTDRNKSWVKTLRKSRDLRGPPFVAVGIGHFVGKGNLLELLRDKGYRVKRL